MNAGRFGTGARVLAQQLRAWLTLLALLAAGSALLLSPVRSAQTQPSSEASFDPSLVEKLHQRGDLTLRDTTLNQALFTISETWKVNLVVGDEVHGKVNGVFQDAPLHQILDSILLANGYSYRPVGQGLVVMKLEAGDTNHPLLETATFPLPGGDPRELLPALQMLNSRQGKVQIIPSARSVLVVDFPDRVAMIRRMIDQLGRASAHGGTLAAGDEQVQVATFLLQYMAATSVKEAIATLLSPSGKAAVMEHENQVVVVDFPSHLKVVDRVIRQLDLPQAQVRITAFIYDVSLEDMESLGMNWNHALKGRPDADGVPQSVWSIDSVTSVPAVGGPALAGEVGSLMTFMSLSRNFDITAVVNALQQATDSRLLADPTVTVLDNEKAMIEIIQEIPFQQLTQTAQGGNIGTTGFREAGVKLQVTPRVSADGTVLLDVTPSFSRLAGITASELGGQPIIDRRQAQTRVRVHHGQTLVIGGLRQRSDIGDFHAVPYLKDLPLGFGKLFRGKDTTVRESELIVFITPEIISYGAHGRPRDWNALCVGNEMLDRIPPVAPPYITPPWRRYRGLPSTGRPGPHAARPPDVAPPEVVPPGRRESSAKSESLSPVRDRVEPNPPAAAHPTFGIRPGLSRIPPTDAAAPVRRTTIGTSHPVSIAPSVAPAHPRPVTIPHSAAFAGPPPKWVDSRRAAEQNAADSAPSSQNPYSRIGVSDAASQYGTPNQTRPPAAPSPAATDDWLHRPFMY